jgi:feruloyl-CoA synthase
VSADGLAWRPGSFAVDIKRLDDGSTILTPKTALSAYPERVTDALEHWAGLAPDRLFVAQRAADGQWRGVTYGQTLRRVRSLASGLAQYRLSAERPMAILSGNSIEHLLLALAAMYIGLPYCPISPAYSQAGSDLSKLHYVLRLLTPGMMVAFDTARFEHAISVAPPDALIITDATLDALEAAEPQGAREAHDRVNADTIAKLLLTSGSTGHPKAVVTTHRMLCSNQIMLRSAIPFIVDEPPVMVDWLPWNHTFGGSHNVGAALFNGGSLYIDEGKPVGNAFEQTVRNLSEVSPTVYFNVPKGFEMLAERMEHDERLRQSFYRRLRACFFAGAGLSQYTWDALDRQALAACGHRLPILSGIGATETAPSVTFTTPDTQRAGVIGLPAPGCIVKIAPVGHKLELRVRSPGVTPGYWRAPDKTAAAFDEQGYYRLGDAVRLIDPQDPTKGLVFDGRITEDFKLSTGTWVSVGPLRASLLHSLAPMALDVVIAGLNRDYVTVLVLPDVKACSTRIGAAQPLPQAELARDLRLQQQVADRLAIHAAAQTGSATRVERALILPDPPSLDRGEITDKGSINQQLMLARWADQIEELYREVPPAHIIRVVYRS